MITIDLLELELSVENKLRDKLSDLTKDGKSLILETTNFYKSYPELEKIDKIPLISFFQKNKEIYSNTISVMRKEINRELVVIYPDIQTTVSDKFTFKKYKMSSNNPYFILEYKDTQDILFKVPIKIRKDINPRQIDDTELLDYDGNFFNSEYVRFVADYFVRHINLKELPEGNHLKVINIHKEKTEKYKQTLVDIIDLNSGVSYFNVIVNKPLLTLIDNYQLETTFKISGVKEYKRKQDKSQQSKQETQLVSQVFIESLNNNIEFKL